SSWRDGYKREYEYGYGEPDWSLATAVSGIGLSESPDYVPEGGGQWAENWVGAANSSATSAPQVRVSWAPAYLQPSRRPPTSCAAETSTPPLLVLRSAVSPSFILPDALFSGA